MTQKQFQRAIVCNPEIANGNPAFEGTRVTVLDAMSVFERGGERALKALVSSISITEFKAAIDYCVGRVCDNDGQHCGGCSLRPHQDGIFTPQQFVDRFEKVLFEDSDEVLRGSGEGLMMLPGTPGTLFQTWFGVNGWIIAGVLREKLEDQPPNRQKSEDPNA